MADFEIKNLCFAYSSAKEKPALLHVDLKIEQGEYIALCGKSGSGKSTLLKHLKSVLTPFGVRSGEVLFDGRHLDEVDHREQSARIDSDHHIQHPHETAEIGIFLSDIRDDIVVDDRCEQIGSDDTGQR